MRTARAAIALAALPLLATATPLGAAQGCAGRQDVQQGATGSWTTYDLPGFTTGPEAATAHAVHPREPSRWWATNGIELLRSIDGGCSWTAVFELPEVPTAEVPASRSTDRIVVLAPAAGGDRLVLAVALAGDSPARERVVVDDGDPASAGTATLLFAGTQRFRALGPLPAPAGAPGPLAVAPSDDRVVYAVAGGTLHASRDDGATWRVATPRPPSQVGSTGVRVSSDDLTPEVSRIAVDPLDDQVLWVSEGPRVHVTEDGGASFEVVVETSLEGRLPLLAVARDSSGPARVTVAESAGDDSPLEALHVSDGNGFRRRPTTPAGIGALLGSGQSMVAGPRRQDLVLTTRGASGPLQGVYAYVPALERLVAVDEFRRGPLLDVQASGAARPEYLFRTGRSMVRWLPEPQLRVPEPPPTRAPVTEREPAGGLPPLSDGTRVLAPASVRIPPGQRRDVPLTLELAPEPTPLDVFFVLDTSGSMNDVIDGLADGFADLADDLASEGIDARYGLGDYQDTSGVRYRQLVDISPPDGSLREALDSIRTAGGAEPAYTALHQIATGSGVEQPSRGEPVPPGQGASWRRGSLRVVVHATDEVPSEDPDGADRDSAVDALLADGARHVGIEVVRDAVRQVSDSELAPPGELHDVLSHISSATGALAPAGGVDCDADGRVELRSGAPLVCELVPGSGRLELAGPLLRVLSSLVDVQKVGVQVGPAATVEGMQGELMRLSGSDRLDVKRAHRQDYALGLTCPAALAGTTRDLRLRPAVGVRVGVPTTLQVVCEPLPGAPAPLQPPEPPGPAALAAAPAPAVLAPVLPPPPPPPPAPANAPAPAGAPAAAPAAAAAPAPAVALAPADEQVELVLVTQDVEQELAMVDRRPRPDALAVRLLTVGLVCAAATHVAMRRRPAVRRTD